MGTILGGGGVSEAKQDVAVEIFRIRRTVCLDASHRKLNIIRYKEEGNRRKEEEGQV